MWKSRTFKKLAIFGLMIVLVTNSFAQTKSAGKYLPGEYATLKYNKVIIYDYVYNQKGWFVWKGKIDTSYIIKKQVTLTKPQIDSLHKILFNTNTYGAIPQPSFRGSFAIVYYLDAKIVSHIFISLKTNMILTSHDTNAMYQERYNTGKDGFNFYSGICKSGNKAILEFCNKLGFNFSNK